MHSGKSRNRKAWPGTRVSGQAKTYLTAHCCVVHVVLQTPRQDTDNWHSLDHSKKYTTKWALQVLSCWGKSASS